MAGNTFGERFAVTTFGESHGPAIGCVIDGCPPGLKLDLDAMRRDLARRATGSSRHTSQRREDDEVEVLSGVFEGKTTGTPIALLIRNTDARPRDYTDIATQFRPGHADYTYQLKYGHRDYRGGGRSSARETTMRVAAASIAKQYLAERLGLQIRGCMVGMGPHRPHRMDWDVVESNPFFWPCAEQVPELESYMDALRKSGDSIGARVMVVASGVPAGLGEPVFAKLDAALAGAVMGINAVKAVEIGDGLAVAEQHGSEHRDAMRATGFQSNHAGGILGGISSGQDVVVTATFKPTSSLRLPVDSLDVEGREVEVVTKGRHDPCVGVRATPIVEAMVALVLMDHYLRHRAQNADVVTAQPGQEGA